MCETIDILRSALMTAALLTAVLVGMAWMAGSRFDGLRALGDQGGLSTRLED